MPWNTAGNIRGPQGLKGDKGDPGNAADIAALIHAAASKTPVDADELPLLDSAGSWGLRKFTWASLKAALQSSFYHRGNILGTVSQTGGIPTGAIIQRGSNANGEFVRFADGTQICTVAVSIGSIDIALGTVYRSNSATWTFPAAFIVRPEMSGGVGTQAAWAWIGLGDGAGSSTDYSFIVLRAAAMSASGTQVNLKAIGRWF